MSGTSFDGVDAAIIRTDGKDYVKYIDSTFVPYKKKIRELFNISILKNYKILTKSINTSHINAINFLLNKNNLKISDIDVIGLHGQTFAHKPEESWSWQYINVEKFIKTFKTNIITDFRLNDINCGGNGAPLVPIYHSTFVRKTYNKYNMAIINIGGVCNATIIKDDGTFIGFDIGPGNGPIDKIVFDKLNLDFDPNGNISKEGTPNLAISDNIINAIQQLSSKRSYDRAVLDKICIKNTIDLGIKDALATIVNCITDLIYKKINCFNLKKIILVGGGRKNFTLKDYLNKKFDGKVISAEEVGWDGDSLEAQAFAYLAVRSLNGLSFTYPHTTGVKSPISGGVLHSYGKHN